MTTIRRVVLPKDERGNDPNDWRDEPGYAEMIANLPEATMKDDVNTINKFRFLSLAEVRKNLKGAQYLIKPFLERETSAILFGEAGVYKSFVSLDQGLCIAFGIPYHGHNTNQGAVFYICGEGESGISRRVEAWLIEHNLTGQTAPFFVSNVPAELIEEGNALEIGRIISSQTDTPPAMVIIDTLSTNIGDGDESSNPDVARLMKNVNRYIRDEFGACVLFVHHVGHGDKGRERGASALAGNADARMMLKAEGEYSSSLHSLKVKDGSRFDPVLFRSRQVTIPGITDSEGEPVTSLVMEMAEYVEDETSDLSSQQQQALALLQDMYTDRVTNITEQGRNPGDARVEVKEWYSRLETMRIVKKGATRQAKNALKNKLKKANLIREKDGCIYPESDKYDEK